MTVMTVLSSASKCFIVVCLFFWSDFSWKAQVHKSLGNTRLAGLYTSFCTGSGTLRPPRLAHSWSRSTDGYTGAALAGTTVHTVCP